MKTKKKCIPQIAVASLSSPLEVGADQAEKAGIKLAKLLDKNGCRVIDLGVINTPELAVTSGIKAMKQQVDAVVFVPVCWFEDYLVLDFIEECNAPLFFHPLPGMETGALCGTQQLTSFLKQLEHPFSCTFGDIGDKNCTDQMMAFLRACNLRKKLRRVRIGLAGHRINGMTHTAPNEFILKKVIGPRIVQLDLPNILKCVEKISDSSVAELWRKTKNNAAKCHVADDEGLYSMKVYRELSKLIDENKLDALTIGCYPHLMGKVCLAASLLADDGIPFGCEGDINGVVGQLMLFLLSGHPTHHTDWLNPLEDGTVIFTHCGSGSFSLAENKRDITLDSVRLMGHGVCALFPAKTGPVTLLSLIADTNGYKCALLEGEALPAEMVFPGNPVRVTFQQKTADIIEWIFSSGIGHHWMIGYGNMGDTIRNLAKLTGNSLQLIEL